ncbi:MAG: protein-glutamate O-methyltransferase CheR [Chloroflexi bacterium]|nr:protein-glutamate O-methyltransferase CheR [Chloroflexota bacterium]MCI0579946.1 protein-glutamate O-methyltransferase CheR [Chloroflexota bacterium]MCI0646529.1 protein-glutamate O-methyltransferase CheR [Chloroflexota bacterium]MCI0726119.1 protein-glutamate O-methyltransferase CheR [Chloroflexota bacterium]
MSQDTDYQVEDADPEIQSLLKSVYQEYGYDFRGYALASLKHRIWQSVWQENVTAVPELEQKILREPACLERFLLILATNTTTMFRDPGFYLACRQKIVPLLRTYPFVRIWHVGCSAGQDVCSLAILLWEEGLYERTRIYATDINETILQQARSGVFPLGMIAEYARNYRQAGGRRSFSDYYTIRDNQVVFHPRLQENVIWATHNLVTDASFNEFHFILCRNVLIHFNSWLQERVCRLLHESLVRLGVLGLGSQESLPSGPWTTGYEIMDAHEKLYRKMRDAF